MFPSTLQLGRLAAHKEQAATGRESSLTDEFYLRLLCKYNMVSMCPFSTVWDLLMLPQLAFFSFTLENIWTFIC